MKMLTCPQTSSGMFNLFPYKVLFCRQLHFQFSVTAKLSSLIRIPRDRANTVSVIEVSVLQSNFLNLLSVKGDKHQ